MTMTEETDSAGEAAGVEYPFERAARRERRAARKAAARGGDSSSGYSSSEAPGMLGLTAAWAVLLGLHAYLGDTGGLLFRIHLICFVLWAALTVGVVVHAISARLLR